MILAVAKAKLMQTRTVTHLHFVSKIVRRNNCLLWMNLNLVSNEFAMNVRGDRCALSVPLRRMLDRIEVNKVLKVLSTSLGVVGRKDHNLLQRVKGPLWSLS